jgi:hypothetical protein
MLKLNKLYFVKNALKLKDQIVLSFGKISNYFYYRYLSIERKKINLIRRKIVLIIYI